MLFLALILNFFSSYFISSIFNNVIVLFVSFFALVILNLEFLSLFNKIAPSNILIFEAIVFFILFIFYKQKKYPKLKININLKRLKNSFLLDKSLIILLIAFLFLITTQGILAFIMPTCEPDSQTYHFYRAVEFVKNHSLNHFETNDIRALIMPINSEIIYAWLLSFKKNFYSFGTISYISFFLCIISAFSIFEDFKFSYRKRLFSIFLFSSLSAVIIQMSTLQTDLLLGSFLISSFALYIKKQKPMIYFSSLALSIALGIKSSGFISLFGIIFLFVAYEILIEKNKKLEKFKFFILCLILNFLIFSSYNYILNFIQFNNFLSNSSAIQGHSFWGGIYGFLGNLIRFFFQFFDFTGFKWGFYLNEPIMNLRNDILNFLNIGIIGVNVEQERINILAEEQISGFGILGFLIFIPILIKAIVSIFQNKNKRTVLLFLLSITFLINTCALSSSVAYMVYSIRFFVSFVALSFLIFSLAYKKKSILIKPIIIFFCIFYMTLISTHIRRMPFFKMINHLKECNYNLKNFSDNIYQGKYLPVFEEGYEVFNTIIENYKNHKKIAFLRKLSTSALNLKQLEYQGYEIDFINPCTITNEKLNSYDLVILDGNWQNDNVFNLWEIESNYKIDKNGNVIFDDNKNLNCFFISIDNPYNKKNTKEAEERRCFTYNYVILNENLKLDKIQKIKIIKPNNKETIYYFTKKS